MARKDDKKPILAQEDHDDQTEQQHVVDENATILHSGSDDVRGPIVTRKLPWGAVLLDKIGLFNWHTRKR